MSCWREASAASLAWVAAPSCWPAMVMACCTAACTARSRSREARSLAWATAIDDGLLDELTRHLGAPPWERWGAAATGGWVVRDHGAPVGQQPADDHECCRQADDHDADEDLHAHHLGEGVSHSCGWPRHPQADGTLCQKVVVCDHFTTWTGRAAVESGSRALRRRRRSAARRSTTPRPAPNPATSVGACVERRPPDQWASRATTSSDTPPRSTTPGRRGRAPPATDHRPRAPGARPPARNPRADSAALASRWNQLRGRRPSTRWFNSSSTMFGPVMPEPFHADATCRIQMGLSPARNIPSSACPARSRPRPRATCTKAIGRLTTNRPSTSRHARRVSTRERCRTVPSNRERWARPNEVMCTSSTSSNPSKRCSRPAVASETAASSPAVSSAARTVRCHVFGAEEMPTK